MNRSVYNWRNYKCSRRPCATKCCKRKTQTEHERCAACRAKDPLPAACPECGKQRKGWWRRKCPWCLADLTPAPKRQRAVSRGEGAGEEGR
jgi:hypothetical protein